MQVVQLREGEGDERQQDEPGLPVPELVVAVHDRAHEKLDGRLGEEEGVRGEDAADGTVAEAEGEMVAGMAVVVVAMAMAMAMAAVVAAVMVVAALTSKAKL